MSFQIGTIYEVLIDDEDFPKGSRVLFIGGEDDDCFTNGKSITYFSPEEVRRSSNQYPLETTEVIQQAIATAMTGYNPE